MTPSPSTSIPMAVEAALVRHYLGTDGPAGAGPVTHIDATDVELKEALQSPEPQGAISLLIAGCGGADEVAHVLERGWHGVWPDDGAPGFFRYLVLTCAVVASADANPATQDFGQNLAKLLRTTRTFGPRSGVPSLWLRLVDWCDDRHRKGEPIRRVALPPREQGAHIGLTNAISFPSWRDVMRLRADLERKPQLAKRIRVPTDAATLVFDLVQPEHEYRDRMVAAARAFRELYRAQASLLHLHRFWTVVCRAAHLVRERRTSESTHIRIELVFGVLAEDTRLRISMVGRDDTDSEALEAFIETVDIASSRLAAFGSPATARWSAMFVSGVVPFLEQRFGQWTAADARANGVTPFMYLVNNGRLLRLPSSVLHLVRPVSPKWHLVGPVPPDQVPAVHRALGVATSVADPTLIKIEPGVRTRAGWLGRTRALPSIDHSGGGSISIRSGFEGAEPPELVQLDKIGKVVFRTSRPLDGLYRLRLEERAADGDTLAVERPIRFTADAPEHRDLATPNKRWRIEPECSDGTWTMVSAIAPPPIMQARTLPIEEKFDDLLEVIYALGRTGWSERELVAAITELVPGPSPWDILRSLQESLWLERRVEVTWRATSWWLLAPQLLPLSAESGPLVVLQGSASATVRERFERTAKALGGTVERRPGVGNLGPLTMVARELSVDRLASELGWNVASPLVVSPTPAPACWPDTRRAIDGFPIYRMWNWETGRFDPQGSREGARVRLSWLRREEGDRADVFQVRSSAGDLVGTSRVVALAEGFRRAGAPMFELAEREILRLPEEGHLPLHLARLAQLRSLRAAGPAFDGRRWRYVYSADPLALKHVRACLGYRFVVSDDMTASHRPTARTDSSVLGRARHRAGLFGRTTRTSL
jgi:hypothetical protein